MYLSIEDTKDTGIEKEQQNHSALHILQVNPITRLNAVRKSRIIEDIYAFYASLIFTFFFTIVCSHL